MKKEYDFSKGERAKFYQSDAEINLPIYLELTFANIFMMPSLLIRLSDPYCLFCPQKPLKIKERKLVYLLLTSRWSPDMAKQRAMRLTIVFNRKSTLVTTSKLYILTSQEKRIAGHL